MSGPERLRLKRRLGDRPPDELIVEGRTAQKRSFTHSVSQQVKYILQPDIEPLNNFTTPQGPIVQNVEATAHIDHREARRTFHLSRARAGTAVSTRKRAGGEDEWATVEERKSRHDILGLSEDGGRTDAFMQTEPQAAKALKRPGRGSAVRQKPREDVSVRDTQGAAGDHDQKIANNLHEFALEELAKDEKPRMTAMPRLGGARSREIHRQRTGVSAEASSKDDVVMEEDGGGYVYDTYVLVSVSATATNEQAAAQLASRNVGYIVITDEDIEAWEMFMEDEASDKDGNSDDEDENAEGYHGADYPEDEMASDDEYDRGAYGYRNHVGSDDEEYDEDTGAYSDEGEHGDELWKRKTPAEFARHIAAEQGAG